MNDESGATPPEDASHQAPAGNAFLEVSDLDAGYGPLQVLFGASLTVQKGERIALLGTNGAGKSTLLKSVAGLIKPSSGQIYLDDKDVTALSACGRASLGMTYIAGGKASFPSLSVLENLRVAAYPIRGRKAEAACRISDALDTFPALRARTEQVVGTLSGGEQQMVAIGTAFVAKPDLLMIDELSLGLAPVVLEEIVSMLERLTARGVTMLIVEQSTNVAAHLTERAYFMEKGQIRFSGPTSDLIDNGDLVRSVFFGSGASTQQTPSRRGKATVRSRASK